MSRPFPFSRPKYLRLRDETSVGRYTEWYLFGWWTFTIGFLGLSRDGRVTSDSRLSFVTSSIEGGSTWSRLSVIGLAALGAILLPRAMRSLRSVRSLPLTALMAYVVWAVASYGWSTSAVSGRRLAELGLVLVAVVGVGAGHYGTVHHGRWLLTRDLIIAGAVAALVLWIPALVRGSLFLWDPEWALTAVGRAIPFGAPVAFGCLALIYAKISGFRYRLLRSDRAMTAAIAVGLLTLVALRKRTLLAAMLVTSVWLAAVLVGAWRRRQSVAKLIVGGMACLVVAVALGVDPIESVAPVLTRGEDASKLESLTGRIPLWTYLISNHLSERPFLGAGYGGFWTPGVLEATWEEVGWPATSAHNGYIDEVLQTGLVGAILLYTFWFGVTIHLVRVGIRNDDGLKLLAAAIISLVLMVNSTRAMVQDYDQYQVVMPMVLAFALTTGPARLVPRRSAIQEQSTSAS